MSPRRWRLRALTCAAFAFAVVAGSVGCSSSEASDPIADQPSSAAQTPTVDSTAASREWLVDTWTTTYVLDALTAEVFEEQADIGTAPVVFGASGDAMTVSVDGVTYTGVTVFGEAEFRFEGATTYQEDDGTVWASDVIISGHRDGQDAWSGDSWARFDSDTGVSYEATWIQSAERTP